MRQKERSERKKKLGLFSLPRYIYCSLADIIGLCDLITGGLHRELLIAADLQRMGCVPAQCLGQVAEMKRN